MLKSYVVAGKLLGDKDVVKAITREECVSGVWEPIISVSTKEEAEGLADIINSMGGSWAYLRLVSNYI